MSLSEMFSDFVDSPQSARRAIFEAAMVERIEGPEGYSMREMLFDLFECQMRLDNAEDELDRMDARIDALVAKITKKKGAKQEPKEEEFDD